MNINKVVLMGRLTADPELRYTTTNNTPVCSFTLAVNRRFAKEGQQQADFISVIAWGKTAEFISKYFAKGSPVAIVGRIQTRTWEDTEGKRHYATEVVAEEVYFAGGKKETQQSTQQDKQESVSDDGFYPVDEDELPF